jgi:protein required for attachment to host cells
MIDLREIQAAHRQRREDSHQRPRPIIDFEHQDRLCRRARRDLRRRALEYDKARLVVVAILDVLGEDHQAISASGDAARERASR